MGAEKRDMPEPNEQTPPKVTFDEAQQKKVDELIRESMGRAASSVKAELFAAQTRLTTLEAELKTAKDAAAAASGDVVKAKDAEILKAKAETVAVKKENAIRQAAEAYGFFNSAQVAKLTEQEVKWDGEKQKFIVVDESGAERLGIDGNPVTLDAFYRDFASKNGHLVKSTVLPGVGSRENQLPTPAISERDKLAKLFGKGSDGVACNRLALSDPAEFKRQRYLAKSHGLI
jgi:hypothetical protein